jgi:hypothetical protein
MVGICELQQNYSYCCPPTLDYHGNNLMECNGIDKIVHGHIYPHNQERLFLLDYLYT